MATEFIVTMRDRPGEFASLAAALGDAGVNIRSLAAGTSKGQGMVGLLVADKDTAKARRALKKAGYRAQERTAIEMRLRDQPGAVAKAAGRLAKKKVNLSSAYVLTPGRGPVTVAFGVKDARAAKKALGR